MSPYKIHIEWIDFNPTIEEDIYTVFIVTSDDKPITQWDCTKSNIGKTLDTYLKG